MGHSEQIDTRFRTALARMNRTGRIQAIAEELDPDCEVAGVMKRLDGDRALLFGSVAGYNTPVIGNVLASAANCEAAFDTDIHGIRDLMTRALSESLPVRRLDDSPVYEHLFAGDDIDLLGSLPVLKHTEADGGRFITAGVVIARDPESGVHNASYHRLQVVGRNRTAIKLDYGRHLRSAFEKSQKARRPLSVAVCLGTDLGLMYTAAAMGSQMPEDADELLAAGGLAGQPLEVVACRTVELVVPAETEIVLEGRILPDETVDEGPFAEFVGYLAPAGKAPVFEITALAHRQQPVYHAINGFGRETVMLRKYVLEASLLKALRASVPNVVDVSMSAGGLHRFHAVVAVHKTSTRHDGLQRNAALASFATLKDLDMVVVVDDDIDIHDPADVEYAVATRMEASRDLMVLPGMRGHEYVRVSDNGVRAKLAIDATVPFAERDRFTRATFKSVPLGAPNPTIPPQLPWLI